MWYIKLFSEKNLTTRSSFIFLKKFKPCLTKLTLIPNRPTPLELIQAKNECTIFSNKTSATLNKFSLRLNWGPRLSQSTSLYLRILFRTYSYYYLQMFLTLQSLVLTAQSAKTYKTQLLTQYTYSSTPLSSLILSRFI